VSAIDWKKLLKQHGYTEAQVRQWAEKKYPLFASNIALMSYLFLQEHGVQIKPRVIGVYQRRKVCDLVVGERAEIEVLVGAKLGEIHYYGCPECYTKVEERENRYYCTKCEKYVEPIDCCFRRYIVGDDTGTVVVVIPPYVEGELEVGKTYIARGRMQDNSEFAVREFEQAELPSATEEEGSAEEEVIEVRVPGSEAEGEAGIEAEGEEEVIGEEALGEAGEEESEEEAPTAVVESRKVVSGAEGIEDAKEICEKAGVKLNATDMGRLKELLAFVKAKKRVMVKEVMSSLGSEYVTLKAEGAVGICQGEEAGNGKGSNVFARERVRHPHYSAPQGGDCKAGQDRRSVLPGAC